MDFMSDDFASFCPVMDLSTGNNNNKAASPSPSNGGEDASSEAGDNNYMSSLRSRSRRGATTPSQADDESGSAGAFSMKETFQLLDAVNKHLGELTNPKLKKYRIWVRIAEDINKTCDSKFNGGQCSSRFRNLKCRFGKLQTHYKSTGELKTWPFYNRMLNMFPDEASFNWLNSVVSDAKQEPEDGDDQVQEGDDDQQSQMMMDEQDGEQEEDDEAEAASSRGTAGRSRGGHTAGFTTNSAGELVPCFTLRESMTLLDVVKKHIAELKDPRTCKGKIWAKVAAEVNKKCGCGHTGAQCSARYRNLKCRFLKRKQKGTDMTWTFGAKLASVLDAENEVKVEMAAAAGSLSDGSSGGNQQHHQLSSLLASGNSNGKSSHHDDEPMPLKVSPSSSSHHHQFAPTVTAADLRSHRSSSSTTLNNSNLSQHHHHQSQPLDLHHTRHHSSSSLGVGGVNGHHSASSFNALQQQQQRRRRSRISTGPRSRFPGVTTPKDLLSSVQVNLVSHASPIASAQSSAAVDASLGGSSSGSDCFTASETVTLLDLVAKYLKDLNSPAESGVRRHDIWTRIAAELNDSYGTHYTSTQCSARFRNLKCRFIKTQEYNRVTGADKKVAFNDNIARLFAAETAMGGSADALNDGGVNLSAIDNNSSSSEQISAMPMVKNNGSSNNKSPLGYASPPTPSSLSYSNNLNNSSPPGAHSSSASNAFQRQTAQQRLVLPPSSSPSVASNRSNNVATSNGVAKHYQNGVPLSNGQLPKLNGNKLVNGSSSSSYYDSQHHQQQIQNAHSRSPSSTSFALPQPVRPQSHQSSASHHLPPPSNNRSHLTSSPNLFANRQPPPNCGVDLSNSGGQQQQQQQTRHHRQANDRSSVTAVQNQHQVVVSRPSAGREAVIEQLRLMHDDWIRVTERRHQEIITVLRQLATHMAAAGLTAPVSLVDGATATALVMCQQPTTMEGAEEILGDVEEEEEEEVDDEMMLPAETGDDLKQQDEIIDEQDVDVADPNGQEDDEKELLINGGKEVEEEEEEDEADLASSISSNDAVEMAE